MSKHAARNASPATPLDDEAARQAELEECPGKYLPPDIVIWRLAAAIRGKRTKTTWEALKEAPKPPWTPPVIVTSGISAHAVARDPLAEPVIDDEGSET